MKKNKLFLLLLICSLAGSVSATIHTINAGSYYYTPSSLTISSGDTVKWINDGGNHDVNADLNSQTGSSFNNPTSFQSSATNTPGAVIYTHIFTVAGTYNYDCSIGAHAAAGMVGSITVSAANTIYDIVSNSTSHTTLKAAIDACSLDGVLSGPGSLTLFAPTDAAFSALPPGTVAALLGNLPLLTDILKHHVVAGSVLSTALSNNQVVTTLIGTNVTVTMTGGNVYIDNAMVTTADVLADNGVVHIIDAVLLPPIDCSGVVDGIAAEDECGTCHESYMYAGMGAVTYISTYADTVGLSGSFVLAGSPVDIMSNPNWVSDPSLCDNTIYDIVSNSNDHTILKAAIDACALDGVLSGAGPFTLFAPTDAAFDLLPAGTVTALLNDIPQLTDILKHHVVGDSVVSTMLSNNQVVTTLNNTDITVTISNGSVYIDNAMVTVANIEADNGVVHVIDAVLSLPSTTSVSDLINKNKSDYLYTVNLLGKRVSKGLNNQIIFDVYDNGDVIKRFVK